MLLFVVLCSGFPEDLVEREGSNIASLAVPPCVMSCSRRFRRGTRACQAVFRMGGGALPSGLCATMCGEKGAGTSRQHVEGVGWHSGRVAREILAALSAGSLPVGSSAPRASAGPAHGRRRPALDPRRRRLARHPGAILRAPGRGRDVLSGGCLGQSGGKLFSALILTADCSDALSKHRLWLVIPASPRRS